MKPPRHADGHHHHRGGTHQFVPSRPGAFLQFFPGLARSRRTSARTRPAATAIVNTTRATTIPIIYGNKSFIYLTLSLYGGGGGIRTPGAVSRTTVFKTVAIDHSATPPANHSRGLAPPHGGRAGGTRTPNRRFWRPLLYQLSYRPMPSSGPSSTPAGAAWRAPAAIEIKRQCPTRGPRRSSGRLRGWRSAVLFPSPPGRSIQSPPRRCRPA